MRIEKIAVFIEIIGDHLGGLLLVAAAAAEKLAHLGKFTLAHGIISLRFERVHSLRGQLVVPARILEKQPFEIGGDDYVHGRAHGLDELAARVVSSAAEKVGQDLIAVGRAYQPAFGHAHAHGVISRQNVAEIARGHAEIHPLAEFYLARVQKVAVSGDIIGDLRREPAPIYAVGGRELVAAFGELRRRLFARENALDRGLSVVKIALDRANADVFPFLRYHLPALHVGNAVRGIEDDYARPLDVAEPLHRRLARVAGSGGQNERLSLLPYLALGSGEQMRQHGQRHVLERAGRTMPKLEEKEIFVDFGQRTGIFAVKSAVSLFGESKQFVIAKIVQKKRKNESRPFRIIHAAKLFPIGFFKRGELLRHIKPAVGRDTLDDRLRARNDALFVSRADVFHMPSQ